MDVNITTGNANNLYLYKTKFLTLLDLDNLQSNVKYICKYNIDLEGNTITIPSNCLIEFDGGRISNGTLIGNNTILIYDLDKSLILKDVTLAGTFKCNLINADELDITYLNNILQLKNKEFDKNIFSGLGRIYLKKNLINNKNVITQNMLSELNVIYHILYDYDLNGSKIYVPDYSTLKFEGGSISNGMICVSETSKLLNPNLNNIRFEGINTCFTSEDINILELYPDYFTFENNYIYGLPDAINTFIKSINYIINRSIEKDNVITNCNLSPMLGGIRIKLPSGNYVIDKTINLEAGVSLIGSPGVIFSLDLKNNSNIGIDLAPTFRLNQTWQYNSSFKTCEISHIMFVSKQTLNNFIAIRDSHAVHEIHHLIFGLNIYRWIESRHHHHGYNPYYGDGRKIYEIRGNAMNECKIFLASGDGQNLNGLVGNYIVVLCSGQFTVSNTVATEFVLINCKNVTLINCYAETQGLSIYDSKVTCIGCAFGNPEHGKYDIGPNDSGYESGKLFRNIFLNNIEIDTPRILEHYLEQEVIGDDEYNNNKEWLVRAPCSSISLTNCTFFGLDYRRDNKSNIQEEFNYIYYPNNTSTVIDLNIGCTTRLNYDYYPGTIFALPLRSSQYYPIIKPGESILHPTSIPSLTISLYSINGSLAEGRKYTDLEDGTYYYRVGVFLNLQSRIGTVSDEVSITLDNNATKNTLNTYPILTLNYNVLPNQTIVIWRGTESNKYSDMCWFLIPKEGLTRNYYDIKTHSNESKKYNIYGDSKYMINGFKYINNLNESLNMLFNPTVAKLISACLINKMTKINDLNNYRYYVKYNTESISNYTDIVNNIKTDYLRSFVGKLGDELVITEVIEDDNDQHTTNIILEHVLKGYKIINGVLRFKDILTGEDPLES